jgi:hypothetical protein
MTESITPNTFKIGVNLDLEMGAISLTAVFEVRPTVEEVVSAVQCAVADHEDRYKEPLTAAQQSTVTALLKKLQTNGWGDSWFISAPEGEQYAMGCLSLQRIPFFYNHGETPSDCTNGWIPVRYNVIENDFVADVAALTQCLQNENTDQKWGALSILPELDMDTRETLQPVVGKLALDPNEDAEVREAAKTELVAFKRRKGETN